MLESKKEENKEKKLGLLKEVEAFPAGKTEENITVIQIVMFLKGIHDKWKAYSPVPDKDFTDLNNKFKESRDGVNKLLEKVEIYNRGLKEEVIAEVQGLSKDEIDESVAKIRELQEKWRTLGPAGKKLDPQINEQFEKACDEFLLIKDKELDESRGIMEGIIKQLRDKAIAPGEAEQQFAELENLQGTQEEKKFKKAIKDFAMLQKNEKAQEKLKSYQDLFEELIEKGSDKVSKELIPSFVNGKPSESMDLNLSLIHI